VILDAPQSLQRLTLLAKEVKLRAFDLKELCNDTVHVPRDRAGPMERRVADRKLTSAGGHAHLFTRDIKSAMNAAKLDGPNDYLVAVLVAKNWSPREQQNILGLVDHAVILPSERR
jgi:hypothetical protein